MWADLDRDRRVDGSRPNENDYVVSVILVTHQAKSYIYTTDRRDFGGKPSVRTGAIVKKIRNFVALVEPYPKTGFLRVLGYPSTVLCTRKQFYPKPIKPMVPMESRDSEGVPFASLESLRPGVLEIQAPEGCRKVVCALSNGDVQ